MTFKTSHDWLIILLDLVSGHVAMRARVEVTEMLLWL